MGAKKIPYQYPKNSDEAEGKTQLPANKQEQLKRAKIDAEQMRNNLQKRVIDNPMAAKKAALVLANWIKGKKK